jgi:hypothetical protein
MDYRNLDWRAMDWFETLGALKAWMKDERLEIRRQWRQHARECEIFYRKLELGLLDD